MPAVRAEMGPIPDAIMKVTFARGFATLAADGTWYGRDLDSLPATFPELFRDGWVETVSLGNAYNLPPWLIGLLRQVRVADFSYATMSDRDLVAIASELRPGRDGARLQSVLVPARFAQRYRELVSAGAGGVAPGTEAATGIVPAYPGEELSTHRLFDNLSPVQFALLAHAGHLRGARYLNLDGEIGDAGLRVLAAAAGTDDLTMLDLGGAGIGPDGLKEFASSPCGQRLEALRIFRSPIGDELAAALGGIACPRLSRFALVGSGLTDAGATALTRCGLPALKEVNLRNNALTREGVATLLQPNRLSKVTDFDLTGNPIPAEAWFPLVLGVDRRASLAVDFGGAKVELSHTVGKPDELHLRATGKNAAAPGLFAEWANGPRPVVSLILSQLRFDAAEMRRLADALAARRCASFTSRATNCGTTRRSRSRRGSRRSVRTCST